MLVNKFFIYLFFFLEKYDKMKLIFEEMMERQRVATNFFFYISFHQKATKAKVKWMQLLVILSNSSCSVLFLFYSFGEKIKVIECYSSEMQFEIQHQSALMDL
jgi:hypothetical protein